MILKILFFNIFCILPYPYFQKTVYKTTISDQNLIRRNTKEFKSCFENLGCFETTKEWYHEKYRPRNLEPLDRHTIRTEFILIKNGSNHTKPLSYETLSLKTNSILQSGYKKGKQLVILVHDFTSNGYTGWIKHVSKALLRKKDLNLISVDWQAGAEPPFEQAISNARVVALEIVTFIDLLKNISCLHENSIHIIGHGVGAHIAGYVGTSTSIEKITGLDPTGPFFEKMPLIVRLDPSDADYVQVLHTDAFSDRSQGGLLPLGHTDFYVNGAQLQPNCNESSKFPKFTKIDRSGLKEGEILPACSHKRAFKYYIESFDNTDCEFTGIRCDSYDNFLNGKCTSCKSKTNRNTCAGFHTENLRNVSSSFYLDTRGSSPYCMNAYGIKIRLQKNENAKKYQMGNFELIIIDDDGEMANAVKSRASTARTFEAGRTYNFVYYSSKLRIKQVTEARLKWTHKPNSICVFCNLAVYVDRVDITLLSANHHYPTNNLCAVNGKTKIENGNYMIYETCPKIEIPSTTTECTSKNTRKHRDRQFSKYNETTAATTEVSKIISKSCNKNTTTACSKTTQIITRSTTTNANTLL